MLLRHLLPLVALTAFAALRATRPATAPAATEAAAQDDSRSTADGVYTTAQANAGRELWAGSCNSCHTPHNGVPFRNKWIGRDLATLFFYTRSAMPQSDPGSLADDEYVAAIAFLMRQNGMPTGEKPLPADSASLSRIRFDTVRTISTSTTPRR